METSSDSWRSIDRKLAETESAFDFLTLVSPTNLESALERFERSGCSEEPELASPELDVDVEALRAGMDELPFDRIEDPDVRFLLEGKREELRWQLSMLQLRDTPAFLVRSMLHYGPVSRELLKTARRILADLPATTGDGETVDTDQVHERARTELERYRRKDPSLDAELREEEDQEGLQASHGDLLIPEDIELPPDRLEALVQHEVGAHVVTHHNGEKQPLQVLRNGLADYDEVQEAFGVLGEYFAGGVTNTRLRTLAARTLAVRYLEDGAPFSETHRVLAGEIGMSTTRAFEMTARIYACGGLNRDQIYLRGIVWLLRHLASGGELEPLYIGKVGIHQIPSILRLRGRGFLEEPALRPAFLDGEIARGKLDRLRAGLDPVDLASAA